MIRQALLGAIALIAAVLPVWGASAADRYAASTIVSGAVAETRADGLARCLREVLVKVSGNPALLGDPRVAALVSKVAGMVDDFAYLDRMSDLPHHDEQGSRDRPFTLIAHFSPAKIDTALARLGEKPWRGKRPRLLVRITVHDRGGSYPITSDADDDERQREALLAAAERFDMRVVLLPKDRANATVTDAVPLTGTLTWSDSAFGWVGAWHLNWHGRDHAWGISGVSFDAAYRNAVLGALAVLSGHNATVMPPST